MFIGIHRTCVGLYAAGFLDHVVLAEVGSPGFSLNKSAVILMALPRMPPESLHPACRSCRYGQLRNAHGNTDFVASPWKRQAGIPQRLSETKTREVVGTTMSMLTTNLAALSSDKWNRTCPCLYPLSRRRRWSRARLLCRQTTLMLLEKDRSRRSLRWSMTPKSIRTDIICMNHPPRVQRGHIRRPGHSPQRTVSDDRRRGKHDQDCTDCNRDAGGVAILRGCDRRMRSSSLAAASDIPSSGRRRAAIHICADC